MKKLYSSSDLQIAEINYADFLLSSKDVPDGSDVPEDERSNRI
jgi:hypothetical protein